MLNNFCVFEQLVFFDLWILDSGFRIPDSGFRIPDPEFGFRFPDFRVAPAELCTKISCSLQPWIVNTIHASK